MALGGPIGGWIADHYGWRVSFHIQASAAIVSSLAALAALESSDNHKFWSCQNDLTSRMRQLDIAGCLLLLLTLSASYAYLVLNASTGSFIMINRQCIGFIALASALALCILKCKVTSPILSFRQISSRSVMSICILNFISSMIHQSMLYNIPLFAIMIRRSSAAEAGAYMMPISLAAVVATFVAGVWIKKTGRYKVVLVIGVLCVTSGPTAFSAISFLEVDSQSYSIVEIMSSFPSTFGYQLINVVSIVALLSSCDKSDTADLTSSLTCECQSSSFTIIMFYVCI